MISYLEDTKPPKISLALFVYRYINISVHKCQHLRLDMRPPHVDHFIVAVLATGRPETTTTRNGPETRAGPVLVRWGWRLEDEIVEQSINSTRTHAPGGFRFGVVNRL